MESSKLFSRGSAVLNAREEFGDDDQVDDQGGGKERILTDGVHGDGIATTHHEFRMVLIHSNLGVSDCGNVLDDDAVVDGPSILVVEEDLIGGNDVVDNGRFRNLLGTELAGRRQVLPIIVSCSQVFVSARVVPRWL